jgi:outer membrane protein assembly factor BamD
MRSYFITGTITGLILMFLSSCSNIENIQGADKAETFYLRGEAYFKESSFEQAIEKFNLVKNKFPYSKYAVDAELRIADSYYAKADYVAAQKQYELFSEFHPTDARRDYAVFQSGMSYYELMPSAVDRDLSYGPEALQDFKSLMEIFPNSIYFKDALNKYTEIRTKLAEKEMYIGKFYLRKDQYEAALGRYVGVINNYSGLGPEEDAYVEAVKCLIKLDRKDDAKYYLDLYQAGHPSGKHITWVNKTKAELDK